MWMVGWLAWWHTSKIIIATFSSLKSFKYAPKFTNIMPFPPNIGPTFLFFPNKWLYNIWKLFFNKFFSEPFDPFPSFLRPLSSWFRPKWIQISEGGFDFVSSILSFTLHFGLQIWPYFLYRPPQKNVFKNCRGVHPS